MDVPATTVAEGSRNRLDRWSASLPPAPFLDATAAPGARRLAPLSPRVAILIMAAIIIGLILWMARDSIRPFIIGLQTAVVVFLGGVLGWLVLMPAIGVRRWG